MSRPSYPIAWLPRGVAAVALAVVVTAAGLPGCTPAERARPGGIPPSDLAVAVLSGDLAVGRQRLALALRDRAGRPVAGGPLHLWLTPLPSTEAVSTEAVSVEATAHPRPSGNADVALYAALVDFPRAGAWQVQVEAPSGQPEAPRTGLAVIEVHPTPATPLVGAPAPLVAVPHLAGTTPLGQRTSAPDPDAALYQTDPAAVIGKGQPVLLTFAAPSLCPGGACAAQIAVLSQLHQRSGDRLHLIHVDPYPLPSLPAESPAVVRAWNLPSQPWTFVVDARGVIAAKFEGFVGVDELNEAAERVLAAVE